MTGKAAIKSFPSSRSSVPGRRYYALFIVLGTLVAVLFLLDIFLGSVPLTPSDVVNAIFSGAGGSDEKIIMNFRLPKALTALFAGAALSVSGLQMQTLFRNPMAGPYVLGISSGASLGVAIVILGLPAATLAAGISASGNWLIVISACTGAAAVMAIMMFISSRVKDIMTVLILGIMISSGISAVVTILQYFSHESMLKSYVIWTMGSLGNLTGNQLNVLILTVTAGLALGFASVKMLNGLLLGESHAASIGMNVKSARVLVFGSTSILAGSVTAFCGPIGFIGIAVPHIVRLLFRRSDHRILAPASVLTGGAAMLLADIISQLPGSEIILPVNAVTSLLGLPVVIWVIIRNQKYSGI